jgi:6-phosphofructokinase 1
MCVELINEKVFGVMVAARGDGAKPVPIAEVAGQLKMVPLNHPWIGSARRVGTSMGD